MPEKNKIPVPERLAIYIRARAGEPYASIAKAYGVSGPAIRYIVRAVEHDIQTGRREPVAIVAHPMKTAMVHGAVPLPTAATGELAVLLDRIAVAERSLDLVQMEIGCIRQRLQRMREDVAAALA
jgi:hypothetical protein